MAEHVQKRRKLWDDLGEALVTFEKHKDDPEILPSDAYDIAYKATIAAQAVYKEECVFRAMGFQTEAEHRETLRVAADEVRLQSKVADNDAQVATAGRRCADAVERYTSDDAYDLPPDALAAHVKEALAILGLTEDSIVLLRDTRQRNEWAKVTVPFMKTQFGSLLALKALCVHMRRAHSVEMEVIYEGAAGLHARDFGVSIRGGKS